jgi:hypothetical protein
VIYRLAGGAAPEEFTVRDIGGPREPFQLTLPLKKVLAILETAWWATSAN